MADLDLQVVLREAHEMALTDNLRELQERGTLLPAKCVDPLKYLGGYSLEEYEMMERDRGKYLLYWAAIKCAMADIVTALTIENDNTKPQSVTCCVLGAGLGRLVSFILDAASDHNIDVTVLAIDANPIAVLFLTDLFEKRKEVKIFQTTILPHTQRHCLPSGLRPYVGNCHILVSELLGCFADNEFCGEVLEMGKKLFCASNVGVCIPTSYQTFIAPVYTSELNAHIDAVFRNRESFYIFSPPPHLISVPLYSSRAFVTQPHIRATAALPQPAPASPPQPNVIFGFAGFFRATLYKSIEIDTREGMEGFNSFHWGAMYFPLTSPVAFQPGSKFSLSRHLTSRNVVLPKKRKFRTGAPAQNTRTQTVTQIQYRLWYEWLVFDKNGVGLTKPHNKEGSAHAVHIES